MTSVAIFTVVAALGVHWGWQPVAGGGIEYIIRIDPYSVDSMKEGHDVFSDLPRTLPEIRSYRITVSDKPVPHEGEPPPPRSQSVSAAKPPGEATAQPSLANDPPPPSSGSRLFPPPKAASSAGPAIVPPGAPIQGSSNPVQDSSARPAMGSEPKETAQHPATASSPLPSEKPAANAAGGHATAQAAPSSEASKPWPALTGALIVLFASLAANAWLIWAALDLRAKYLAQLAKLKPAG